LGPNQHKFGTVFITFYSSFVVFEVFSGWFLVVLALPPFHMYHHNSNRSFKYTAKCN